MSGADTECEDAERKHRRGGEESAPEFERRERLIVDDDIVAGKQRRWGRGDWIGSAGENARRPLTGKRAGGIEEEADETVGVDSVLEVERHLASEFIAKRGRMHAHEQAIETAMEGMHHDLLSARRMDRRAWRSTPLSRSTSAANTALPNVVS